MASQKQIAANRRNSKKSTGPNTPEGKEIVSQNAVRHGLLSTNPVVSPEEQHQFNCLAVEIETEFMPQGIGENLLATRVVDLTWRLYRVSQIETGLFLLNQLREKKAQANNPTQDSPVLESPGSASIALATAYTRQADAFARVSRHERQIERSLQQARVELSRLQYARQLDIHPFYIQNMRSFPAIDMSKPQANHEGHYYPEPRHLPATLPACLPPEAEECQHEQIPAANSETIYESPDSTGVLEGSDAGKETPSKKGRFLHPIAQNPAA